MSRQTVIIQSKIFDMKINPAARLRGEVILPGDKSISHRAAIFSALADGVTRIHNFGTSADCAATVKCLQSLGVEIERDGSSLTVKGVGKKGFTTPATPLDCENSGTTMRLMAGVLAGQNFDSVLIGDKSLQKRPMKRVMDPLRSMGAADRRCRKPSAAAVIRKTAAKSDRFRAYRRFSTDKIMRSDRRAECGRRNVRARKNPDSRSYRADASLVWRRCG